MVYGRMGIAHHVSKPMPQGTAEPTRLNRSLHHPRECSFRLSVHRSEAEAEGGRSSASTGRLGCRLAVLQLDGLAPQSQPQQHRAAPDGCKRR
jgi:hypothetical protein